MSNIVQHSGGAFASLENFEAAQRMAKVLAASKLVPATFQNNIGDCVIAMEMANRMGANTLAVMQNLYIVHGKPGWSSTFIIAAINQSGRFKTTLMFEASGEDDDKGVYAYAYDHDGNKVEGPRVTMAMAKAEGWTSKNGSKWITMPDLMLRYRAASFFGRLFTPDLLMGLKTHEEIIDTVGVTAEKVETQSDVCNVNALLSKPAEKTKPEPTHAHNPHTGEVVQSEAPVESYQALSGQFVGEMLKRKVTRSDAAKMAGKYSAKELEQIISDPGSMDQIAEVAKTGNNNANGQAELDV